MTLFNKFLIKKTKGAHENVKNHAKKVANVGLWLMFLICAAACGSLYYYASSVQIIEYPYWADVLNEIKIPLLIILAATLVSVIILKCYSGNLAKKAAIEAEKEVTKSSTTKKKKNVSEPSDTDEIPENEPVKPQKTRPIKKAETVSMTENEEKQLENISAFNATTMPQKPKNIAAPAFSEPKRTPYQNRVNNPYDEDTYEDDDYAAPEPTVFVPQKAKKTPTASVVNQPMESEYGYQQPIDESDELIRLLNQNYTQNKEPVVPPTPAYPMQHRQEPVITETENFADEAYNESFGKNAAPAVPTPTYTEEPVEQETDDKFTCEDEFAYEDEGYDEGVDETEETPTLNQVNPPVPVDINPKPAQKKPIDPNPLDELLTPQATVEALTSREVRYLDKIQTVFEKANVPQDEYSLGEFVRGKYCLYPKDGPDRNGKIKRFWLVSSKSGLIVRRETDIADAGMALARIFQDN